MVGTIPVSIYAALANALEYPEPGYREKVQLLVGTLGSRYPLAAEQIAKFVAQTASRPVEELEELYTRTFDMAPVCVPYVTSYIYGQENFQRGELMALLKEEYRKCGLDAHGELPDHIGLLLRFLDYISEEEKQDLAKYVIRKPLKEMVSRLGEAGNPFRYLMSAVLDVIQADYPEKKQND